VKQSYDMAVEICREEAKEGIAYAQFKLGVCYERGRGVEKNEAKAVEWYSKAAAQDHISACGNLGVCYEEGAGVTRDMNKALLYYEKAANKGDILTYFNLGMNHEDHDVEKAKKWYRKAAAVGYLDAQVEVARLCQSSGDKESLRESVMWYTKVDLVCLCFNVQHHLQNTIMSAYELQRAIPPPNNPPRISLNIPLNFTFLIPCALYSRRLRSRAVLNQWKS